MSFDESKAFEAKNGFKVKKGAGFYSGEGAPLGSEAALGSLYTDSLTGIKWEKCGPGLNDWSLRPMFALWHITNPLWIKQYEEMRVSGLRISGNGSLKLKGTLRISG